MVLSALTRGQKPIIIHSFCHEYYQFKSLNHLATKPLWLNRWYWYNTSECSSTWSFDDLWLFRGCRIWEADRSGTQTKVTRPERRIPTWTKRAADSTTTHGESTGWASITWTIWSRPRTIAASVWLCYNEFRSSLGVRIVTWLGEYC